MRGLFSRWANEEEQALKRQLKGKTARTRFDGLDRSERNEASLFLLALAPALAVSFLTPRWSESTFWEKALTIAAVAWAVAILGVGGALILRTMVRLSAKTKSEGD